MRTPEILYWEGCQTLRVKKDWWGASGFSVTYFKWHLASVLSVMKMSPRNGFRVFGAKLSTDSGNTTGSWGERLYPEIVRTFFELCETGLTKISSQPHRLFNVHETGMTFVQLKQSKVKTLEGKVKKAHKLTSGERGCLGFFNICFY
jgi:hypothetical protein